MSRTSTPRHLAGAAEHAARGRDAWRPALAIGACLAAAVPFGLRVARNLPGAPLSGVPGAHDAALALGTLGPALVALALAVDTSDPIERVGLVGLAVAASLPLAADAAYLPAAVGVTLAASVVAWRRLERAHASTVRKRLGRPLLAALAVAALGCSLAASVGLAPPAGRRAGTLLALAAAVTAGIAADADVLDWALGASVAAGAYAVGASAPYVTGAVALVAGGAIGASLPLLAAGVGGLATALAASLRRGALVPACGALLLCVAAVPVTVPRALAAALGVAFLVGGEAA